MSGKYVLTFQDQGGAVPVDVRLRRLLKLAGRYLALRCVDAREQPEEDDHDQAGDREHESRR